MDEQGASKQTEDFAGKCDNVKDNVNDDQEEQKDKERLMELLHKYNDIKDATQRVLGALAVHEGVTVKEMHKRYNLPMDS